MLTFKPAATPVFRPRRPVPYAALLIVEQELQRLQEMGIGKKSNGSARLCADYSKELKEALEYHQYPLPLPEDLSVKLNGGGFFAKSDLPEAYLRIPVSDESKNLLTLIANIKAEKEVHRVLGDAQWPSWNQ
ncbi:unnamed protein product [Schistosoma margrebowiei]|uniref:Uncharacterized protein n=1 Tax=Schistosoma margrebowiei TaxID=48269 RepID=A0A3P8I0G4_9TREM|nr:unnamed protein product [Schistosoma margrebowiei]